MTIQVINNDNLAEWGIETLFFPGGEPHVKVPELPKSKLLLWLKLRTWNDVGIGAMLMSAVEQQAQARMSVFMPYFPGARQDKKTGNEPFAVDVMARLFGCAGIVICDPHSTVTTACLLNHVSHYHNIMPWNLPIDTSGICGVIAPDLGAKGRATGFRNVRCPHKTLVQCYKKRDSSTGMISHYEVSNLPETGKYLIVDDVCDGGLTFNMLCEALRKSPSAKNCTFELLVSHGIFSKGLDNIDPMISKITTTDSWCVLPPSERLTVISLLPLALDLLGEKQ